MANRTQYNHELNKHKTGDKIKWIVAFGLIILLGISILVVANPKCIFGHDWKNGICAECATVCEHEEVKDGKCADCGMVVEEAEKPAAETNTDTGSKAETPAA